MAVPNAAGMVGSYLMPVWSLGCIFFGVLLCGGFSRHSGRMILCLTCAGVVSARHSDKFHNDKKPNST